ncbi:hypothetical protein RFI_31377 [Reticulomyxa filosa]|uniref:Uncharacterized protein n=1 Tax=Reticulomyxa filosa TaxID=46433 RepID=X6LXZ3_RETFI|nr:hypothetical protein RFI_31377 [Reticulomyxa filosa]|eukprot:ETO06017.1 hypothetical protein RFI_31377 [Reticulomyxa filosa]
MLTLQTQKMLFSFEWAEQQPPTPNSRILLVAENEPEMYSKEWKRAVIGSRDDIHIVFSTGCNAFQNWQSELLLHSWASCGSPGRITRIVAGCKSEEEKKMAMQTALDNKAQRILFYFVPDYAVDVNETDGTSRKFSYFNKPYGFNHWLADTASHDKFENQWQRSTYESVIVLIDPDMIILRCDDLIIYTYMRTFVYYVYIFVYVYIVPFLFHLQKESRDYYKEFKSLLNEPVIESEQDMFWVREGKPVSQRYGIGVKWVHWDTNMCPMNNRNTGCNYARRHGQNHYSVGPPYIMHVEDWLKLAPKWVEFSPESLRLEPPPSMLAEMYSFAIASAYYDLRHANLFTMLSNPEVNEELWSHLLNWDFLEKDISIYEEKYRVHILHYCALYFMGGRVEDEGTIRLGGLMFGKQRLPRDFLFECEIPLLVELPLANANSFANVYDFLFDKDENPSLELKHHFWKKTTITDMFMKRDRSVSAGNLWMLYHIHKFMNEAVGRYRLKYCPNFTPQYSLVLQQAETDRTEFRVNYVIENYSNHMSWIGG